MLKQRIYTVLVLLPLLLAAMFYAPSAVWAALLAVLLVMAAWEWATLAGWPSIGRVAFASTLLGACLALWLSGGVQAPFAWNTATVVLMVSLLFWLVAVPLWLYRGWQVRSSVALALAGAVVLLPAWLALTRLQKWPVVLLALMGIVWISDTAAYFAGRRWGRRKLAPAISPGKSWEGVFGATVAVALYCVLANLSGLAAHPLLQGATGCGVFLLLMALGIEGDLFESWIKRTAGVKDSGSLLPGHGGVLDRVDALTASMPAAAAILSVVA